MTLPSMRGATQVMLGNPAAVFSFPAGATVLPTGNPTHNAIDTYATFYSYNPTVFIPQPSFSAYQDWYPEYPDECVSKVGPGVPSTSNYIRPSTGTAEIQSTYPTDIVYFYNPASPAFDPVPNPNGTVGNFSGTYSGGGGGGLFPRWHTDTPYDMSKSASYDYWRNAGYFPFKSHDYIVTPTGGSLPSCCSADLTVTNLMSEVTNTHTSSKEYYYFDQASFDYTQTGKLVIPVDWEVCCWNDGTVINGTASFSSIDVTTVALGNSTPPGFGFTGMTATTGTTITAASSVNFTVTISSGYTPVVISVPVVSGKITFITDFWITSVVAPT